MSNENATLIPDLGIRLLTANVIVGRHSEAARTKYDAQNQMTDLIVEWIGAADVPLWVDQKYESLGYQAENASIIELATMLQAYKLING